MNDSYQDNSFEKAPGDNKEVSAERMAEVAKWKDAMADAPGFAGDAFGVANKDGEMVENNFGIANESNGYYGETINDGAENNQEYDDDISGAAALINYGVDAAARKYGVENVVQKLKGFDFSGREDPIGDFFQYMEIENPAKNMVPTTENEKSKLAIGEFRENINAPSQKKSVEGAFKAIEDMKELISEVEGANPAFEVIREKARREGKGYFEAAVSEYSSPGLTELFSVLAQQREKVDNVDEENEVVDDNKSENVSEPEQLNPEIIEKNAA